MNLRSKVVLLAVLPVLIAVGAIGAIQVFETRRLDHQQAQLLEDVFLDARRAELRNYIALALTSIDHLYGAGRDDEAAKAAARAILGSMNFGDDGYFFVYDEHGVNLVHPRQRELVGRNLWDLRDDVGVYVIRELTARAREGGGFQRYRWPKPSTQQTTDKLAYAVMLPRWGWMLGTGIYLDDVQAAAARMRGTLLDSVQQTMLWLAAVAVAAVLAVFAGGVALNISEQRVADRKLKALAHRVVSSQEEERARVSRELHDHIGQMLVSIKYQFELLAHRLSLRPAEGQPAAAIGMEREIGSLSEAIAEVRRISHDLRPASLDNLGLRAALDNLGNELAQRSGVSVRTTSSVPECELGEWQAVCLFRVAQEALRNIEQHAQAKKVEIELCKDGNRVQLLIVDDGCGFDVQRVEDSKDRGIGLSNMRERIERNGGGFSLYSRPGRTLVRAWFGPTHAA